MKSIRLKRGRITIAFFAISLLKTAPERRHPIVHVDPTTAISSSLTPAVVGRLIDPFTADAAGAGGRRGDGIRPTHTFL